MQIVLAITGGGTQVIGNYLSQGGKSDCFLEAVVPYCMEALDDFIGMKPDNYCSATTARQMAMASYERVGELRPNSDKDERIGLGITCSLIKNEKERVDRTNMVYVARQTRNTTEQYTVQLDKNYLNSRELQEKLIGNLLESSIERCLATGFGSRISSYVKRETLYYRYDYAHYPRDIIESKLVSYPWNMNGDFVYPGSFNLLHDGHKAIVAYLRKNFKHQNVFGELSIENVDKVSVDAISLRDRQEQIKAEGIFDKLLITKAAKFVEKFGIFRNARFVMGADTYNRLTVGNPSIWAALEESSNKLYVFGRLDSNKKPIVMELPIDKQHLVEFSSEFEPSHISSSELRQLRTNKT